MPAQQASILAKLKTRRICKDPTYIHVPFDVLLHDTELYTSQCVKLIFLTA